MYIKRPIVIVALSYLLSLSVAFLFNDLIIKKATQLAVIIVPITVILMIFSRKKSKIKQLLFLVIISLFSAFFMLYSYNKIKVEPATNLNQKTITTGFKVVEEKKSSYNNRYIIKPIYIDAEIYDENPDVKIQLSTKEKLNISENYIALLNYSLPKNTSTFDYKFYQASIGIYIHASVVDDSIYFISRDELGILDSYRNRIDQGLYKYLSDEDAAVAKAVLVGDRTGLDDEFNNSLRDAGLGHLLAISGIHITLFVQLIQRIFKLVYVTEKRSSIICILFIIFYMMIVGFSPSVFRAGIANIIYLFGLIINRQADTLNSMAISAILTAVINPYTISSASFILSYMAMLGIIYGLPKLDYLCRVHIKDLIKRPILSKFFRLFNMTLAINVFLLPANIYFFRRISPISLVSNLVAQPFIIIIILGSLFLAIFSQFNFMSPICILFGKIVSNMISGLEILANIFSDFPYSSIYVWGEYLIYIFILIILVCFVLKNTIKSKKRFYNISIITCVLIFLSVYNIHNYLHKDDISLVFTNVEKSSSFALVRNDVVMVVLKNSYYYDGKNISNILNDMGIQQVDFLVIADKRTATKSSTIDLMGMYVPEKIIAPDGVIHKENDVIIYSDFDLDINQSSILSIRDKSIIIQMDELSLKVQDGANIDLYTDFLVPVKIDYDYPIKAKYSIGKPLYNKNIPVIISNDYDEIILKWHRGKLTYGSVKVDI